MIKNIFRVQLEHSENFRLNTEKTINKLKEEFQCMVQVSYFF
jgi:hypothetical protein